MKGIEYVRDDKGRKEKVIIDLRTHAENEALEDLLDVLDKKATETEERIPWEEARAKLIERRGKKEKPRDV